MRIILSLAILGVIGFGCYRIFSRYKASTGTRWERLSAAVRGSATVLWAYIVLASGYLIELAIQAATLLERPEVKEFIQTNVQPEYVGISLIVIGGVALIARLRTLEG